MLQEGWQLKSHTSFKIFKPIKSRKCPFLAPGEHSSAFPHESSKPKNRQENLPFLVEVKLEIDPILEAEEEVNLMQPLKIGFKDIALRFTYGRVFFYAILATSWRRVRGFVKVEPTSSSPKQVGLDL